MNMKTVFRVTVFGLLLFSCYTVVAEAGVDKIVAVVNGDVITQSELDKRIEMFKLQLARSGVAQPKVSAIRQQVLDGIINVSLQLQLAKHNNIKIDESDLNGYIANIAKNNNITVAQLEQSVPKEEGMSFKEFRNQIREQALINRVQQMFLGRGIAVSDEEATEVLRHPPKMDHAPTQYHVVDILLEVPDGVAADQLAAINKVAKQMVIKLQQGVNAEDVVKEGQNTLKEQKFQSNDLGWRKADDLPTLFAKDIVKMQPKQTIGPLKAPNGLHLIKLLEVHGASLQSAKLTKEQAYEMVYQRKLIKKLMPWLEERRSKAYIKISK